ncbi:MAG: M4 family metallopeptidase [Streptosporangiales bacterium]
MTYCAIVPPYLLQTLQQYEDADLADCATRALELDAQHRAHRSTSPLQAESAATSPHRSIYDAGHAETLPGSLVREEGAAATDDGAVNHAYDHLGAAWKFYYEVYERDSLNGHGLPLVATVHYGQRYDNAFWNGEQMVFGDGDGTVFTSFTGPVDITAHELTHGVTQYTAKLAAKDQAGALNESISDVFGVLTKQHALGQTADEADWIVGEGLFAPGINGKGLRSLAAPGTAYDDPKIGKDPQPATMDDYVETSEDNGGVHTNSGIPNHAFYLAATELGGHAWERAGLAWYQVLTAGAIPHDSDFATFAQATIDRAHQLGGNVGNAVRSAWEQVKVLPGRAS